MFLIPQRTVYYNSQCGPKGTVFFFSLEKFAATHSLDFRYNCIFFFRKLGKKNTAVLFFSQKEFTCHSLNFSGGALIKNRGKWYIFSKKQFSTQFFVVFFFTRGLYFFSLYFFFPENSLNLTHSLVSNHVFFFSGTGIKKLYYFYSLTRFWTKLSQK